MKVGGAGGAGTPKQHIAAGAVDGATGHCTDAVVATSSSYSQTISYRAMSYSIGELHYLIRTAGMTWDGFMQRASLMDANDVGALFGMLRASTLGDRADPARFLFYLDLAQSVFPHSSMMRLLLAIPTFGQYTSAVFFCQADWNGIQGLVPYYERFGARVIDTRDGWARMAIPLLQEGRHGAR